jgi:hypothetical protein
VKFDSILWFGGQAEGLLVRLKNVRCRGRGCGATHGGSKELETVESRFGLQIVEENSFLL